MDSPYKNIYSSFTDESAPTATYNDYSESHAGYGQLVYPSDLFNEDTYSNSYTAFFISFKEDPYIEPNNTVNASTFFESAMYERLGSDSINSVSASGVDDDMLTMAIVGAGAAGSIGYFLNSKKEGANKLLGEMGKNLSGEKAKKILKVVSKATGSAGVATAAAAGAAGAILANNSYNWFGVSADRKTQKSCICLPTPMIVANYEINWSEESNKLLGGLLAGGADFMSNINVESIQSGLSGAWEKMKNVSSSALNSIGSGITAAALSTPMIGSALGVMSREAANPRKEQLFKDVAMREFSISYIFAPTSEQEAKNVESIIKQFKYHAHPSYRDEMESGANGNLLNYPSEFDIVHYYRNKRNTHLPKHATSVLKRVSVDYANGSDNYTFLPNGMPSIIKMDLTFAELAMLTKKDILEGY